MTLKLYTVVVRHELVVLAANEADAVAIIPRWSRELPIPSVEANEMMTLPADMAGDEIPFGRTDPEDPDRSIDEWIERGAAPQYTAMLERFQGRST